MAVVATIAMVIVTVGARTQASRDPVTQHPKTQRPSSAGVATSEPAPWSAPSSTPAPTPPPTPPPRPTSTPSPRPTPVTTTSPTAGWAMTWQDEFNDPAGTRPSSSRWVYDLGGEPRWGNQEWQYYTDRAQNLSTDGNGNLAVTARREKLPGMENCRYGTCDITSGRITTKGKFNQAYGRFEARIKIPAGPGLWPAFWTMGNNIDAVDWPNNGEIDVMEVIGREPSTLYGTLHGPGYSDDEGPSGSATLPEAPDSRTHSTFSRSSGLPTRSSGSSMASFTSVTERANSPPARHGCSTVLSISCSTLRSAGIGQAPDCVDDLPRHDARGLRPRVLKGVSAPQVHGRGCSGHHGLHSRQSLSALRWKARSSASCLAATNLRLQSSSESGIRATTCSSVTSPAGDNRATETTV